MDFYKDQNISENICLVHGEYMEMNLIQILKVLIKLNLGLFLWRGVEKPFEITDHPSYDYHKFTKLEFSDPKTRELVTEYWCGL